MSADAAILSSLSHCSTLGFEEELRSTATRTSSSNSSGCKRDYSEAAGMSNLYQQTPQSKRGGLNRHHGGSSSQHDMQSLSASLTEGCQMSSSELRSGDVEQQQRGYCPPRRASATNLDLFEPGVSGATKAPVKLIGKPSVPLSSVKAKGMVAGEGKRGVTNLQTVATATVVGSAKQNGRTSTKGTTITVPPRSGGSGGVRSMLESTVQNIKSKKLMPKPSGTCTEVKLTTIVDDTDNEVSVWLCI